MDLRACGLACHWGKGAKGAEGVCLAVGQSEAQALSVRVLSVAANRGVYCTALPLCYHFVTISGYEILNLTNSLNEDFK